MGNQCPRLGHSLPIVWALIAHRSGTRVNSPMVTVTLGENVLTLRVVRATLEVRRKTRRKYESDCKKTGWNFASHAKMMILWPQIVIHWWYIFLHFCKKYHSSKHLYINALCHSQPQKMIQWYFFVKNISRAWGNGILKSVKRKEDSNIFFKEQHFINFYK